MGTKRKRGDALPQDGTSDASPAISTVTYKSGKEIRDALQTGTKLALISFEKQIRIPPSRLPVPINHASVVLAQHYIGLSPSVDEVFKAWKSATERKELDVAVAAIGALTSLIELLTPLPYFRSTLATIVERVISSNEVFGSHLNRLITSSKREHSQAALGLAAACAHAEEVEGVSSYGSDKVWSCLLEGGIVKVLPKLLSLRRKGGFAKDLDPLDKPDIRHLAVKLLLPLLGQSSFLATSRPILKAFWSNIREDPSRTILRILTAVWKSINGQATSALNRKVTLALIDENAIDGIMKLYARDDNAEAIDGFTPADMAHHFLLRVCSSPGTGICFPDEGWYRRKGKGKALDGIHGDSQAHDGQIARDDGSSRRSNDGIHNRILANVLRRIGPKVAEESKYAGLVEAILRACPELVAGYWPNSALSVDPKLSSGWISTISFIGRILSLPLPVEGSFRTAGCVKAQPPSVQAVIEAVIPSLLGKQHLSKGLQHSSSLVQHLTALTLARALGKYVTTRDFLARLSAEASAQEGLQQDQDQVNGSWSQLLRDVDLEARKRLPDITVVIAFAQNSAASQALQGSVEESDNDAKARAELLTEVALRLFGLYHQAFPSTVSAIRFDVGKLLVSSASAKMEADARKLIREGSVASDVGSVASIGTVGSIGMGGGFGQSRGDVQGFDGLSQIHVIQLLSRVTTWSWAAKAGGSQYTYLYHILQLYLETPHEATRKATESLLRQLLAPSIMFEHDPMEVDAWLSSMPKSPVGGAGSAPAEIAERLHLLSFLDDCVRRCMKTPHRYMEDVIRLQAGETVLSASALPSPLLATVLEQLQAKIAGHIVSAEAARIIIRYIRQVVLALSRKDISAAYLRRLAERMLECLTKAEGARSTTLPELRQAAQLLKDELESLLGSFSGPQVTFRDVPALPTSQVRQYLLDLDVPEACSLLASEDIPEEAVISLPFEWIYLHLNEVNVDRCQELLDRCLRASPTCALPGVAKTVLRRLHVERLTDQGRSVRVLDACMALLLACLQMAATDPASLRASKNAIFTHEAIAELCLDSKYLLTLENVAKLPSILAAGDPADIALASDYTRRISLWAGQSADSTVKPAELLVMSQPWAEFLDSRTAALVVSRLDAHVENATPVQLEREIPMVKNLLSRVSSLDDLQTVLPLIVKLQLFEGASEVVERAIPTGLLLDRHLHFRLREAESSWAPRSARSRSIAVPSPKELQSIVNADSPSAVRFLAACSTVSSKWAASVQASLQTRKRWDAAVALRWMPVLRVLQQLGDAVSTMDSSLIDAVAAAAVSSGGELAGELVVITAKSSPDARRSLALALSKAASGLSAGSFKHVTSVVSQLAQLDPVIFGDIAVTVLEAALRWQVGVLSDIADLGRDSKAAIVATTKAVEDLAQGSISSYTAESVLIAITQDRLAECTALDLASALAAKADLKATTIRQSLQTIMASSVLARAATLPANDPLRTSLTKCIKTLSIASPYVACQPNFVEPLLGLYGGTTSEADLAIFAVLRLFETYRKLSVASMFISWTPKMITIDPAARRSVDVLTSLDPSRVFGTCLAFDARRSSSNDSKASTSDGSLYDVVFVLSLTAMVMKQGNLSGLDWVEILRSNVLGLAVCSLSSRRVEVRDTAAYILAKAMQYMQTTAFQERPAVLRALRLLRHDVPPPAAGSVIPGQTPETPRMPFITTLFFAHVLRAIADPSSFLYPLTSRFLLQRPVLDGKDVPMLYGMLYAAGEGSRKERRWIVRFIRDAARSREDWHILQRRHTFALLATIYETSSDNALRKMILQAIASMVHIPAAACQLVDREGLLPWLMIQLESARRDPEEFGGTVDIFEKAVVRLCQREESSEKTVAHPQRRWVKQAELLAATAAKQASLPQLRRSAEAVLRLSLAPGTAISLTTIRALTLRLRDIDLVDTYDMQQDPVWQATVSALVRAGLTIDPAAAGESNGMSGGIETMRCVLCRAALCSGQVGDFVRQEWMTGEH